MTNVESDLRDRNQVGMAATGTMAQFGLSDSEQGWGRGGSEVRAANGPSPRGPQSQVLAFSVALFCPHMNSLEPPQGTSLSGHVGGTPVWKVVLSKQSRQPVAQMLPPGLQVN